LIGYFSSEYPTISHTFIRRELSALRRKGIEVRTFSIHRPPRDAPLGAADRQEEAQTFYVQPPGFASTVRAHLGEIFRSPLRYGRALGIAVKNRPPGARAALWSLFYFAEGVILAGALRHARIRHLHVHFARAGGDVARIACFLAGISWSLMLHSFGDFEYPAVLTIADKIGAARFAACASYFVRAQVSRVIPIELWDRLLVVRCGVELGEPPAQRSENDPLRIVCVGRLSPEKGQYQLLHALAQILPVAPPFRVTFVGDGPTRSFLEATARELGVADAVEFIGARSEPDTLRILAGADIFALASLMEGLPVVLLEAMALGVPVVAPHVAGIPELVTDGANGLLFPSSDCDALAAQLRRLLGDRELRRRFGQAGRARVAEEFAIDRAVEPLFKRLGGDGSG